MSGIGSVPPPPPPPPSSQTATQSQSQTAQSQQTPPGAAAAATGQAQTAQAVAQAQAAAKSVAISLSPSLAGLTPGQQVTGTIAQLQAGGLATLQTPGATYTLQTSPALPLDSEIKLQILSTGSALRAQVLSVNGLPPALLQNASVNLTLTALGAGAEGAARAQAEAARAVQGSTPGTALPAVKAGVQLQALVLNDGSAAAAAATQTSSTVAQTQSTGTTLPPGTRLMVQVAQIIPPQQQAAAAQAANANPGLVRPQSTSLPSEIANAGSAAQRAMTGQVVAPGPDGQLIVRAGGGLIRLDAGGSLPIGTLLRLDVLSTAMPAKPATQMGALVGADPRLQGLQTLGGSWANLRSALEALQQADPRAAQALAAKLPGPNAMLVNNMIGFMGAAAAGDARAWLGPTTTKALEKAGKSDLIDKLDGDLKTMGRMAQETQTGDWRAQIIPFYDGHEIQQIRMFMKRNRRKDKDGKEQPGSTRVLVDMSLTALGDMQIDGLIKEKRFDMIMRTRFPVTDAMRNDLLEIFIRSLELSGMTGGLQFTVQSDFPSGPPELLRPLQGKSGYLQV